MNDVTLQLHESQVIIGGRLLGEPSPRMDVMAVDALVMEGHSPAAWRAQVIGGVLACFASGPVAAHSPNGTVMRFAIGVS